ncbi:MAG: glutamyl-tRNA(Gln) and/or aspartyl-tRNA(Asn) amidotransferase, C subunit [uncultured bacterium]|nr:MAG: glutamyl-tRNA(Gln) and/or aspartyl-tRNA(Asn) amidotransferase, C subunit [uncultured bacterium]HBR71649.1 Asp-tRNA(Asn)/Glu-tRNA(Gln) amidotransferase subunit GatB [Candidatus Moranbacteria bacterium]
MLSVDEIKHIANLARISLKEKEIEKYQKDLSDILEYFKKMEELDTEKVEPIGHITGMKNVSRFDKASDFGLIGRENILKNAPEMKNGYVKVKSVL